LTRPSGQFHRPLPRCRDRGRCRATTVASIGYVNATGKHGPRGSAKSAHYLLIVKRNQPGLHAQVAALPWRDVLVACTKRKRGHGRTERRHRGIEDRLHWFRDMDCDEDRSQVRTASGPRIMASLRNLVITILRLVGTTSIATALRYHARRPSRPYRRS
jgi:hypothetical protein